MVLLEDKLRVLAGKAGRFVRGGRGVGVGMVGMMLIGALWLGTSVTDTQMPADAKASQPGNRARQLGLNAQSIDDSMAAPGDESGKLSFNDSGDIWRTDRQNLQRYEAATMAKLSRLISNFQTVRAATVLFASGSPGRLGTPAIAPTAAVNVKLRSGHKMTPELIAAIADLVAGSIAGMDRRQVRIIDSLGVSYCLGDESSADSTGSPRASGVVSQGQLRRMQAAEAQCAARVRTAVANVPGAVVSASSHPDGRIEVLLLVPRSRLLTIATTTDRDGLNKLAATELAKLRTRAMAAAGLGTAAVQVRWYGELPAAAGDGEAKSASDLLDQYARPAAVGLLAAGLLAGLAAIRIHKPKRPGSPQADSTGSPQAAQAAAQIIDEFEDIPTPLAGSTGSPLAEPELHVQIEDAAATGEKPFDGAHDKSMVFLSDISPARLTEVIAGEHPQTIALLMSKLTESQAAGVLARLGEQAQGQVIRRLAGLEHMDPMVMAELWRALAERLEGLVADRAAGASVGRVAQILHHAGYETERVVLESLADHSPGLADSIRSRMFAFEDIVHLSDEQLSPALAAMDSDELAVALRTTGKKLRKRVFSALSFADGKQVRREMERIGPVRLSDIEAAQYRVIELIRRKPLDGTHAKPAGRYVSNRPVLSKDNDGPPNGQAGSGGTGTGGTGLLA